MIARHLRKLREVKGWSIPKLAEESKVSKGYIWELEQGQADRPSLEVVQKLARALGVTIADLLGTGVARSKFAPEPPASLKEFASRMKKRGQRISKEDIEQLALFKWRGKAPKTADDWEALLVLLKRLT